MKRKMREYDELKNELKKLKQKWHEKNIVTGGGYRFSLSRKTLKQIIRLRF